MALVSIGFLLADQCRSAPDVDELAGPVLGMVFVGISGLIATWRVVTHSPLVVLRAI